MNTQPFKTESLLWVNFKRTMYALMVIVVAIAIPLLSYLELSYNSDSSNEQNVKVEKTQNFAASNLKQNTVKL